MDDSIFYWLRWIAAIPLGVVFILCAVGNWGILLTGLYNTWVKDREYSSSFLLPFAGPLIGIGFFLLIPISFLNSLFWLAVIIEPMWLLGLWCLVTAPFVRNDDSDMNRTESGRNGD